MGQKKKRVSSKLKEYAEFKNSSASGLKMGRSSLTATATTRNWAKIGVLLRERIAMLTRVGTSRRRLCFDCCFIRELLLLLSQFSGEKVLGLLAWFSGMGTALSDVKYEFRAITIIVHSTDNYFEDSHKI